MTLADTNNFTTEPTTIGLARQLAAEHRLATHPTPGPNLRPILDQIDHLLNEVHEQLRQATALEQSESTAAEWLLDNYFTVQLALKQVAQDLPASYYAQLPKLVAPAGVGGYPRVYDLARQFVLMENGYLDVDVLSDFLDVYQENKPLTMGEVWAVPIMLRFCLLACLAQAGARIIEQEPPQWSTESLQIHLTLDDTETVANCITSLRLIDNHSWKEFFEEVSVVEQELRHDPAGIYAAMDFTTRDRYRKAVEALAEATGKPELTVARESTQLARTAAGADATGEDLWSPVASHNGAYLIGPAHDQLEAAIGYQRAALPRWLDDHRVGVYLGSIFSVTLFIVALFLLATYAAGGRYWQFALVAVVSLVPAAGVATNLVGWLATLLVEPARLPKLDLSEGIPESLRTMVVIPALLTSTDEVSRLLSQIEQHYLRNPDQHLGFALLTDYADAPEAQMDEDEAMLAAAREGIASLNRRYRGQPFYLFHRRRLYNPSEGSWMGWERKRGKLHEFNQLIMGQDENTFIVTDGDLSILPNVRYVITLDADTILPTDTAAQLIGTLAHPLNQARFDPESHRVIDGYTILQPRTETRPTSAGYSLFTRVFAGDVGLDLYSMAVSDVYQDLFGEGIYVGKGIYDVRAFERSLSGRVPENALLSHDLFEGIHGRAGLVTDIVLYEDFPHHYLAYVRRADRWIRGDWQLLPWLRRSVPSDNGRRPNDLSIIARWKLLDNLRRSLTGPMLLAFFMAGWLWLPGSPLAWTWAILALTLVSFFTAVGVGFARAIGGASWREIRRPIRDSATRWLLQIAFLPYEALLSLDAILTTLFRLSVTRRHLLQWTTAANTSRLLGDYVSAERTAGQMIRSLVFAVVILLVLVVWRPEALLAAAPLLLLWVLSSEIAYFISRPDRLEEAQLTQAETERLRRLARRTWLFFEEFVGPEDNWLPPDHFQEMPWGTVAHRTSPTNIGLYLSSALAAYQMGYAGALNLSLRLEDTFNTLDRLERYNGHFLNWIDTRTLHSLSPRYISTVDSGNLAGCLIALKQGCLAIKNEYAWRPQRWDGLADTIALLEDAVAEFDEDEAVAVLNERLRVTRQQVEAVSPTTGSKDLSEADPNEWLTLLDRLHGTDLPEIEFRALGVLEQQTERLTAETIQQWRLYLEYLRGTVEGMRRELRLFNPWLKAFHLQPMAFGEAAPASVRAAWQALRDTLSPMPKLGDLIGQCEQATAVLEYLRVALANEYEAEDSATALEWCTELQQWLQETRGTAASLLASYELLARRANRFVNEMNFRFLYHAKRNVFHIGYNMERHRLDNSYYDLLASEARIASLVAIAKRDVPQKHWLHLGRPLSELRGGVALLSWSGTMFEYLMPPLFLRSYDGTLLDQSCEAVVDHQIAYGENNNIPWGISESGYYLFDNALNYQYRAFGVPGTGLKRGLADDLVVSPYSSFLAIHYAPKSVLANLDRLLQYGMLGPYGVYEALDFTSSRLQLGQEAAIVRSYMAHHQGMLFLALANYLHDDFMVTNFHKEPAIESVELLLQEQIPTVAPLRSPEDEETRDLSLPVATSTAIEPWTIPLHTPVPLVHHLSNGRLHSLITNSGGGFLSTSEIALTRWRPDTTRDHWGLWLYIRDADSGAVWSPTTQPVGSHTASEVTYSAHMAQFRGGYDGITAQLDIAVAPDADVEIRRLELINTNNRARRLDLSSYAEVVLTDYASDNRHPAFAKLFVESEYVPEVNALLFRRRPRSGTEKPRWMAHMVTPEAGLPATRTFETDRAEFLGRTRTVNNPQALHPEGDWLTGTTGATLDPIMALGQSVELQPQATTEMAWITLTADSREELLALARTYQSWMAIRRAFTEAHTQANLDVQQLDLTADDLALVQRLLSVLIYPHATLRADDSILAANSRGQSALWAYGISGDYPILLLRVDDEASSELLSLVLRAHAYWRRRGLQIDLVILNQAASNYGQPADSFVRRLIRRHESEQWVNKRGGIFLIRADQMSTADRTLIQTAARVVLDSVAGSLAAQLAGLEHRAVMLPEFVAAGAPLEGTTDNRLERPADLLFDNGWGGFATDGETYVIHLEPGQHTPAPWCNVIANDRFGFLVSETGGGFSWMGNSSENRLTTWRNDPVSDVPAEALYLRDEETGRVWSPTPQPAPTDAPYQVEHGAGYSRFIHLSHDLHQETTLFAALDAPVKIVRLDLENLSERPRRLTVTFYAEWVLGTDRNINQAFIIPSYRADRHALMARNPYNTEFSEAVAFLAASCEPHGLTVDRAEFIGRQGSLNMPAALKRVGLSDSLQVDADPCAVIQVHIDLPPGGSDEVYFLLGQGEDELEALETIDRFRAPAEVRAAWEKVGAFWDDVLGTITVETPDKAMDLLLNRWLLYQALSCRIWGRSALYQSGGAYGYRDQLQDVMSLLHARPDLARAHLLRSARHQFEAGDVLHWWHPPSGRGVRTRITDDLVWLPYVTAHYIVTTGDDSVLDDKVPFLEGALLGPDEEERYGQYGKTEATYSLYEHCCRALDRAATRGRSGLPLMGAGDWNDGMNRVGIEGHGESVWLGWFIAGTLKSFAQLCEGRGDHERANRYRQQAESYRAAAEQEAWDGDWYLRAFYDDGTPLGSHLSEECRIDAIAQSWAVLTGLGDSARAEQALASVDELLIQDDPALLLLFAPPFDKSPHDPGYIKGYIPGIRENGGQYTHAALWTIWAMADMGWSDRAMELYGMINPIQRAATPERAGHYKVEPYVISADVYGGGPPHAGRGGWTWYTGSSGWMYRLGVEGLLGMRREANCLHLVPRLPSTWPGFRASYRYGDSHYEITVENVEGSKRELWLDDEQLDEDRIPLQDDGRVHHVLLRFDSRNATSPPPGGKAASEPSTSRPVTN